MQKSWSDFGLWLIGVAVMAIGAACPIYLFTSEGFDSLFGDIVYVIAGILLFIAGLGITFFRVWRLDQAPAESQPQEREQAGQPSV